MGMLGKNISHHGWLMVKCFKITLAKMTVPKKQNQGQKVNDSKTLIWSQLGDKHVYL